MPGRWTNGSLRLAVAIVLGALIPLALVGPALAQQAPPSAELKRVIGRVEILRKGQAQWIPAVIGARLVEGDDIRAFSGAQAELALPDASTVQLAENSRLLMTKLEYDQQQQTRFVLMHLVVGKVRAAIAQTAITLVRARQSNFGISTPTAVAAARGTIVWVYTDGARTLMAVEPEPGLRIQPRIECITVATSQQTKRQMVLAGYATTDCGPTVTATQQLMSLSNPATAGTPLLNAPVAVPANIEQLVTSVGLEAATGPVSFSTLGGPFSFGPPASFGNDAVVNQQIQNQNQNQGNQSCASNGGQQENCQGQQGQ
ncbi:MAG TPA: FecR family protein [Streptosporangiaceae bacterium]|nr:FecR family protein [Streptosporangiaceae bacterium]